MTLNQKKLLFDSSKLARYNVASWKSKQDNVFLITREIERKSKGDDPDFTKLLLVELDKNLTQVNEKVVWQALSESLYLEDPRAMSGKNDSVVIGLTALLRGGKGEYIPYPAITKLYSNEWREQLPAITLIESFGPGKNTTPVEEDVFFFRKDGIENRHNLTVFSLFNSIPKHIQTLKFPTDLPWAKLRIGTGMPPLWITSDKALMIFHGITLIDGKYVYSLGRSALIKKNNKYEIIVDRKPLINKEFFRDENGEYLIGELHPHLRKVVYCCGGILKPTDKNTLILFINVGDMNTFLVEFPIKELVKGLF